MSKPYYQDDYVTLFCGDCMDIMPEIDGTVDLVVTDPPYGLGKKMSGGTWGNSAEYKELFKWDKLQQGAVTYIASHFPAIIWGGNYYQVPPSRCWLVWEKIDKLKTTADFELAWTSFDKVGKLFASYRNVKDNCQKLHASQKPIALIKWCIEMGQET